MGMLGEVVNESTLRDVLKQIDNALVKYPHGEAQQALKSAARSVIDRCFDWEIPEWARQLRDTKYR